MKHFSIAMSLLAVAAAASCKPAETTEVVEVITPVEEVVVEDVVFLVDEYHIDEKPITTHTSAKPRVAKSGKSATKKADAPETQPVEAYKPVSAPVLVESLVVEYELEPMVEVSTAAIPLDETQTVQSFNKKGKNTGAIQIVSDQASGEIDHIVFEDKNHKDYYDVHAGMSAKEVKKLRKEMKHMMHKGQVFFYSDDSNIMYLLDTKTADGKEVVEADVDESFVSAVVWKDKNHPDHPKMPAKK